MYKIELHLKLLTTHLDKKASEVAGDLGVTKKELFRWFKEENSIPSEKLQIVSDYFALDTDEFYDEVTIEVTYAALSKICNDFQQALNSTSPTQNYEDLSNKVEQITKELVKILIEGQVQLNLKKE